ncbi:MAG: hypothetical protein VB046_03920 [Paludibacter sp.]|nr:hypothetical protein [Paludibacter sp.]
MKKRLLSSYLYLILLSTIILSSCETEGVSRISFDNNSFALRVGQSDTLVSTISFTGDIEKFPVEWTIDDPSVISIVETTDDSHSKTSGLSSVTKSVIITALKAGSTALTINTGGKTHSCQVTVTQQSLVFTHGYAANWGDIYGANNNNFTLSLLESSLSLDDEGYVVGDGYRLFLDFYLPLTQNTLSAGTFNASSEEENYTFYPGIFVEDKDGEEVPVGSFMIRYSNDNMDIVPIVDGTYEITKNGDNFVIEGEFTLENNEIVEISYEGIVYESDQREKPVEINPALTKGVLLYFGDAYNSKSTENTTGNHTNNYALYLGSETIDFNNSESEGDILMIEFNTPDSVHNYIPDGTYQMMTELTYQQLVPFSLVFAYQTENEDQWGTWFYGATTTKALNAGNMTVAKSGENYSIQYEFYDRIGSKVWGTYNGPLTYIDGTQESSAAAPRKIKGFKSLKKPINEKFMQINKRISKTRKQVELLRR